VDPRLRVDDGMEAGIYIQPPSYPLKRESFAITTSIPARVGNHITPSYPLKRESYAIATGIPTRVENRTTPSFPRKWESISSPDPSEPFVYNMSGIARCYGIRYIDSVILRDRDANTNWEPSADSMFGRGHVSYPHTHLGGDSRKAYAGYEIDPVLADADAATNKHWLGFYHVRNRVYISHLGRWTRRNPIMTMCATRISCSIRLFFVRWYRNWSWQPMFNNMWR